MLATAYECNRQMRWPVMNSDQYANSMLVIASGAKQSRQERLDCFGAARLAMTELAYAA
jgi:hypothetical protein